MNISAALKKIPRLSLIAQIARKRRTKVWLVGGFLRDICLNLNKDFIDFDFCVEKGVLAFVKAFSCAASAKFIVLDEGQESYRVIIKNKNRNLRYDFTAMRGEDLPGDLSRRDFTINTLALDITDKKPVLFDYLSARDDLRKKVIRAAGKNAFFDDPLRIMRAFSFMANYGFKIDELTLRAMVSNREFLKNVSGERINEELFKILAAPRSTGAFKIISDTGIMEHIIPPLASARGVSQEGGFHHLDVWEHSLETLGQFEKLYSKMIKNDKRINDYLLQDLAAGHKRIQVIKLACLLHDMGKPSAKNLKGKKTIFYGHEKIGADMVKNISLNLRFSAKEKEILEKLIFWHMRPGALCAQAAPTPRAIYRFFRDTAPEGAGLILLSLSDWRAVCGPLTDKKERKKQEKLILKLLDNYLNDREKTPLRKIVDGYDIMKKFNLPSGVIVGKILKKVKEEQALGNITTKTQAWQAARKVIRSRPGIAKK